MSKPPSHPAEELFTIRDWLRYAVSSFEEAGLVYGHGTDNAVDEAAFLILATLHLNPGELEPWLDCRLTRPERQKILDIIGARITTRKPAPYLTGCAWIQGRKFIIDERTIVPRSFIGELLCRDALASTVADATSVEHVLDLCTGSGCLAILAAELFPNASVTATDISKDALAVAEKNVTAYRMRNRVTLRQSDLFDDLPAQRFAVIISNPPYVTAANVDAFPPEYRAEPRLAHDGGADGMVLVHRILKRASDFLTSDGVLIVEVGGGREMLEAAYPNLPFFWIDTETSDGEVFALSAEELTPSRSKAQSDRKRGPKPA